MSGRHRSVDAGARERPERTFKTAIGSQKVHLGLPLSLIKEKNLLGGLENWLGVEERLGNLLSLAAMHYRLVEDDVTRIDEDDIPVPVEYIQA
jgi:hypothetical protein